LLDALVSYSDACTLPALTPTCPYYVETTDGPRCNDECTTLIEEYGAADRRIREIRQGGLVLRGKQLPISAAAGTSAFDARKRYLQDRTKPPSAQSTSSLLLGLQAAIQWPEFLLGPSTEHAAMDYWAELARRGLPVERIVRTVMLRNVAAFIIGLAFQPRLRAAGGWDDMAVSTDVLDDLEEFFRTGWDRVVEDAIAADMDKRMGRADRRMVHKTFIELLQDSDAVGVSRHRPTLNPEVIERLATDRTVLYILSRGFSDRVIAWLDQLLSNKLEGFLQWQAPASSIFQALRVHARQTDEVALWIWERFTVTRAEDWSTTSLLQEWKAGTRGFDGVPRAVLRERTVDVDLAASLALSKSSEQIQSEARPQALRADEFVATAADLLQRGEFEDAANIFAGLVELSPEDGDALNNLGFCLLPIDPQQALEALQRASLYPRKSPLISTANRVLALHLVGRDDDARAVAREHLTLSQDPEQDVWAWGHECGQPLTLRSNVNSAKYLQELTDHLSTAAEGNG
jgi:tetratricopeptide (TPR) repeat protein